jgi:hypothetical protein
MLALAGATVTEATFGWRTVTLDVPVFVSLVAVITTDPAAVPVTSPEELTVATDALAEVQVIVRPMSVLPTESKVAADSCTVPPITIAGAVGETVTDATGTRATLTVAVAVLPSLVAVMVAEPAATAVTNPLPFTVATDVALELQVTLRPESVDPVESSGVAVSCAVCPM